MRPNDVKFLNVLRRYRWWLDPLFNGGDDMFPDMPPDDPAFDPERITAREMEERGQLPLFSESERPLPEDAGADFAEIQAAAERVKRRPLPNNAYDLRRGIYPPEEEQTDV